MRRLAVHCAWLAALAGCLEAPPAAPEGPVPDCGTATALEDEFEGADYDRELWGGTGGASASDGEARIVSVAEYYNTFYSIASYRVSGSQLVAELDVSQLADALMFMELESSEQARVAITLLNGDLGFRVVDADGERTLDSAPLEQDHVWWRLREEDGQFFWATSPDGASWTERGPFAASIGELARVDFELLPNSQASTLIINAVNPGMGGVYCPAASFQDDLASLSERWTVDEQGDCEVNVDGQAELGYSAQAFCALTTRERFDLRDSAFSIELVEVGDCIPQPIMRIAIAYGDEIVLKCVDQGGEPKLVAERNTGEVATVDYDPAKDRFVRVSSSTEEGNVLFESSTGDGVWSRIGSLPVTAELLATTSLRFYLGGDTTGGEFESVTFDNFNLAPP